MRPIKKKGGGISLQYGLIQPSSVIEISIQATEGIKEYKKIIFILDYLLIDILQ
jgi:hypothetical protein